MYLGYFNHYNIRQCRAQYLWVLYELLSKKLDTHLILNEDYIEIEKCKDRWEIKDAEKKWGMENIIEQFNKTPYSVLRKPEKLTDTSNMVPSEILRYTTVNSLPTQAEIIEKIVSENDIKAGITWVNNKCFKETLREHGIPTIHHELGPLRSPTYIDTVYVDFEGVNGGTEFSKRFKEFLKVADTVPILSREKLIQVISPNQSDRLLKVLNENRRMYDIGVGLQVEVDTNVLLFNKGRSLFDPIWEAKKDSKTKILVREHPLAHYSINIDSSMVKSGTKTEDAIDFINKCNKIYCLNSSVGFEAILLGRKAKIFGDSPFSELPSMDEDTQLKALNFAIFSYLTHRNFLFDDKYYEWRLSCIGDEREIYLRNMKMMLEEIKKSN